MLHNWCCVEGQKVRGWAEHCELEVREGILEEVLPGQTETAQSLLTWLLQVPDYCSMCGGRVAGQLPGRTVIPTSWRQRHGERAHGCSGGVAERRAFVSCGWGSLPQPAEAAPCVPTPPHPTPGTSAVLSPALTYMRRAGNHEARSSVCRGRS